MIPSPASRFDARASAWLRERRQSTTSRSMLSALAHSGDTIVVLPLLALAWWRSGFSRSGLEARTVASVFAAMVLVVVFKNVFRRDRPEGEWGAIYRKTDPHSFPSGHAARTMALAVAALVSAAFLPGLAFLAWSIALGISRVALGVHWLSDALAGWATGACAGLVVSLLIA